MDNFVTTNRTKTIISVYLTAEKKTHCTKYFNELVHHKLNSSSLPDSDLFNFN